jgi:glycyl-tRNA synthetase alpha chain
LYESECRELVGRYSSTSDKDGGEKARFPLLAAYDLCLKCSHLFNILDARGAISVTERVGVIARVRVLAVGIAKAWVDQNSETATEKDAESEPAPKAKAKPRKESLSPVG